MNVTITPILLATPPLVTFIFLWSRLWSITIAHIQWWWSLSIIINHYWWQNLNVTKTPILLAMTLLVTFSFWWWRLWSITIAHMKWRRSLLLRPYIVPFWLHILLWYYPFQTYIWNPLLVFWLNYSKGM